MLLFWKNRQLYPINLILPKPLPRTVKLQKTETVPELNPAKLSNHNKISKK